jgi:hypothetical protein
VGHIGKSVTQEQAAQHINNLATQLQIARPQVGLTDAGIVELSRLAFLHIDATGSLGFKTFVDYVDTLAGDPAFGGSISYDAPFREDPSLVNINTLEDIDEMKSEVVRRFMQPAAQMKDSTGTSAKERFDARVSWIKQNKIHRAPEPEAVEAPPLTPSQQKVANTNEVVAKLRALIDREYGSSYTDWGRRQHSKCHEYLNDLLRDGEKIRWYDRSRQAYLVNSLKALENLVKEKIRDCENPIR